MGHSAVIIGAGIGGLSTAQALQRHGWSVSVLEQAAALPTSGTMLGMWPVAIKALDDMGVDASRRTNGWAHIAAGAGTRVWTPSGRTLVTGPGGANLNLVSRPALLAALARDIDVSFNTQVVDPDQIDDAALLVGADGTFSRTRQRMFGERFRARSLGAVAWRGTVKGAVTEYGETWAPGALFGITPAGPDATNWYACIRADQTFDEPHLPRILDHFGSWHPGVRELIGRIDESAILHHGLFEAPKVPSFVTGNTALVGDAAHAMAPFLGRGACEAILDGTTLGRSVAQASSVEAALAVFNKERRAPSQRLVLASRLMGQFAMMDTGSGIRDAAVGTAGRLVKPRPRRDPTLPRP